LPSGSPKDHATGTHGFGFIVLKMNELVSRSSFHTASLQMHTRQRREQRTEHSVNTGASRRMLWRGGIARGIDSVTDPMKRKPQRHRLALKDTTPLHSPSRKPPTETSTTPSATHAGRVHSTTTSNGSLIQFCTRQPPYATWSARVHKQRWRQSNIRGTCAEERSADLTHGTSRASPVPAILDEVDVRSTDEQRQLREQQHCEQQSDDDETAHRRDQRHGHEHRVARTARL
jgi:hypothetical protein